MIIIIIIYNFRYLIKMGIKLLLLNLCLFKQNKYIPMYNMSIDIKH